MRIFAFFPAALLILSIGLLATACKKSEKPVVITPEQIPATVQTAFKDAPPDIKSFAEDAAASIQNKEEPKAFEQLQALSWRPDLTPEQREAAMRAIRALNEQFAAAAAKGDKTAEEMLQKYRATK